MAKTRFQDPVAQQLYEWFLQQGMHYRKAEELVEKQMAEYDDV